MDESRASRSGKVWDTGIRGHQANETVRLIRSGNGRLRSKRLCERNGCSEQLTGGVIGPVRTSPLPRDPIRCSSYQCDHGGCSTRETGEGETTRIQRRTMEDSRAMLVRRSQRTARRSGYLFQPERCCSVLVYERVLTRDNGAYVTHVIFSMRIPRRFFVYCIHNGLAHIHRVLPVLANDFI